MANQIRFGGELAGALASKFLKEKSIESEFQGFSVSTTDLAKKLLKEALDARDLVRGQLNGRGVTHQKR